MPLILDWKQSGGSDDVVRQAVKAIADGSLIVLPTEAGYVIAANAQRLSDPGRPTGIPDEIRVQRLNAYFDPAGFLATISATPTERAMAMRLWPGAIGWLHDDSPFPAWIPSHLAVANVLASQSTPLALFELNNGSAFDPAVLGESVAVVVSDGDLRTGPVTLIRPNESRFVVERPGIVSEEMIRTALARKIVFVCTGNTCRSPMAEGLFKSRLAAKLGITVDELPARGFIVTSAGVSAYGGDAATLESIEALRDFGVDLSGHRSRPATAELFARADDIIVMTRSHLLTVVGRFPVLSGTIRLLCGPDGDLDDPISGGPDVYRKCAATIHQHVDRLILEMGLT